VEKHEEGTDCICRGDVCCTARTGKAERRRGDVYCTAKTGEAERTNRLYMQGRRLLYCKN
jgi:hypothetical protein